MQNDPAAERAAEKEAFLEGPLDLAGTQSLRALWYAARGDWQNAHEEAQAGSDTECAWVHAMLHRDEGDQFNAAYWYRRAGKPVYRGTVAQERDEMIAALLRSRIEQAPR